MHYLIRLRKILLSNYLYLFLIVIGTIYILINANLKTNSKYKINDKLIFGVLTNYSVDGGKLSLEITGLIGTVISGFLAVFRRNSDFSPNYNHFSSPNN